MMKDVFLIVICLVALVGVGIIVFNIYRTQTRMLREQEQELNQEKMFLNFIDDTGLSQDQVDAYEQQLFDDAAQLFLEQNLAIQDLNEATSIQAEVLKKMPPKTHSEIRKVNLTEWVISWNYYGQSLEYYVRRYGVFYVHVDRLGHEYKKETDLLAAII